MTDSSRFSRRAFLGAVSAATGSALLKKAPAFDDRSTLGSRQRPRVAAIFTVLRFRSHAYNILENFLGPYYFNGRLTDPGVDVVSLYADQFPADDMARAVAQRFGIPLFNSIEQALCVGGRDLAVDAVLSIGEHGEYPYNARGQHLYPRKRFFDEAVTVMKRAQRFVPFFNDKHLSWRWDWGREMFDTARSNDMPLLAGSSVPLAQRRPMLEMPRNAVIEEAVSIHGGGLESYDFHALEVLQSFVESRRGGETGISQIQLLTGRDFERAQRDGRWSSDLVDAAMAAETAMNASRQPRPSTGVFKSQATRRSDVSVDRPPRPSGPYAISIEYRDGLRATVLRIGSSADRWNVAYRMRGDKDPHATALFNGPWGNRCLFKALSHAIQHLFVTGEEPYPADRTLLTTGAVEAVMHSWEQEGAVIKTPHLDIEYSARNWDESRETGDTWSVITRETPQPTQFAPRPWSELRE